MTYKIQFALKAEKDLAALPRIEIKKLAKRIEKLASNPFPNGYKKLKGQKNQEDEIYRVRQGDYRILYSVYKEKLIILIVKIGNRREVYR